MKNTISVVTMATIDAKDMKELIIAVKTKYKV